MTGRHRPPPRFRTTGSVLATLVAVLVVGSGGYGAYHYLKGKACTTGTQTLTVAAAPDIASTVSDAAANWVKTRSCVAVTVTAMDPADVAAAVVAQNGATLTGLGEAGTKARVPDVWIPDSSIWLQRLRVVSASLVPTSATSIALSPVVLALPQPMAKLVGWPSRMPTWADLLGRLNASAGAMRTGLVDPARDASGLSGLLALTSAVTSVPGTDPQAATVGLMRALATGRSAVRADLLGKFPRATDQATMASSLAIAPLTEQSLLGYNAGGPPVPLAGLYLTPALPAMDFPYAVMPGATPDLATLADNLRTAALSGAGFRNQLATVNLRGPDGTFGTGASPGTGAPTTVKAPAAIDARLVEQVLSTWSAVTQPGRMLAVMDVSGSMLTPVPTAGNLTREQVAVRAAAQGLSLFDDNWSVGLWIFSTDMDGAKPYRQINPIVPLSTQRARARAGLDQVIPKKNGNTGLYDTVLAAYKAVQQGWDPGRSNSVVVITDGQNDNPGGLTLAQLTTELQKVVDPKRPIQVIMLGIGTEVSQTELKKVVAAAGGGGAFFAPDPNKISQIFLQAIALRPRMGG